MSCGIRAQQNPQLTTSTVWPPHMSQGGIFDDNPRRKCVPAARGAAWRVACAECLP